LITGFSGLVYSYYVIINNEAFAHPDYKVRRIQEDGTGTTRTPVFGPELPNFNPIRVIKNDVVKEFIGKEDSVPTDTSSEPV
jgi:hypothetical protein